MKNQTTKKLCAFILLLSGIFSTQFLNAQNCPGNKVWACRYDSCGIQECKCISANQVQNWTSTTPKCATWKWHPHCCDGWRIDQNESGVGISTSLQVYPNPVSTSTAISFSLEQSQNASLPDRQVSLKIFDVNGRLVSTLADASFEEGDNEIVWNAADVNAGIYFLQIQTEENLETVKLVVTK